MSSFIKCPTCKTEIPLTEVIDHQIHEQLEARLAAELAERDTQHQTALSKREAELKEAFEADRVEREGALERRARERVAAELSDLKAVADEREVRLKEAQERELALRQERRRLEEEREALDLELARRLDAERQQIAQKAREDLIEAHQLALREKELALEQMARQLKEVQESAEQRRAGLRGEALEREVEDILRERFPYDVVEPIKSGARGADVLQTVSHRGQPSGRILWESKRARSFSQGWLTKLKQDQAAAGADFAVLVCTTMPHNERLMMQMEGVWVIEAACIPALAGALRDTLALVAQARSVDANRSEAMDAIYDYLSSNAFARRIRGAVETFMEMKQDLDGERRAMEKRWSKRATQLDGLAANTAGLYGELEAMMGSALPTVELLELPPAPLTELDERSAA